MTHQHPLTERTTRLISTVSDMRREFRAGRTGDVDQIEIMLQKTMIEMEALAGIVRDLCPVMGGGDVMVG